MSHKTDNSEVVYEGWLTKSPPSKRIWRARWRKRWFVLRHSGELPGQYYLYYYTDMKCRTLKGQIDLDQCEQVDAGLEFENNKHKYRFMFDIRTPKRTYYLAAETENDMNKWVDCVCQVCGLKAYVLDENVIPYGLEDSPSVVEVSSQQTESPPISPASTASGPYIPISECITGKPRSRQLNKENETDPVPATRKHIYSNAVPSGHYFCYDFELPLSGEEPNSPFSDGSSFQYSNISSPILSNNPPIVYRELKPGRKLSDSISNEPSPTHPNIDLTHLRNLKPAPSTPKLKDENCPIKLGPPPMRKFEHVTQDNSHPKSPLETDIDSRTSDHDEDSCRFPFSGFHTRKNSKHVEIQYLDLDLNSSDSGNPSPADVSKSTVYKVVDFLKTEAFNRTRQKVEEERKQCFESDVN